MNRHVLIRPLGQAGAGYRVLACWVPSKGPSGEKRRDAWIPELAPNPDLWRRYQAGIASWETVIEEYRKQLDSPLCQDLLKPLGLLSFRRLVVLVCDCPDPGRCYHKTLAQALDKCRAEKNFILGPRRPL